MPIPAPEINRRHERSLQTAAAPPCPRSLFQPDGDEAAFDPQAFDAVREGFPEAFVGAEFLDEIDCQDLFEGKNQIFHFYQNFP